MKHTGLIMLDEMEECKECGNPFDPEELETEIENTCAECLERMNEGETISEMRNNFYRWGRR